MSRLDWIKKLEKNCQKDDSKNLAEAVETPAFQDLHNQPYENEKNTDGWQSFGEYLLWFAVINEAIACVKVILHVVKVDGKDKRERTVLHYAAEKNHSDIARVLIGVGANVNAKNGIGQSPIHIAAWYGSVQTLAMLCASKGADIDMKDIGECTPLYYAVSMHKTECVRKLLEFGARTDIVGRSNKTPRDWAVANKDQDIVDLLDKAAAGTAVEVTTHAPSQDQSDSAALAETAAVADPNAEVKVAVIKAMVLGNTGAGKSALVQELQAEPRSEHGDSTGIADIGTFYGTDDCKSAWKEGASELKSTVADMICKPPPPPVLPACSHPTNAATVTFGSPPDPSLPLPPSVVKHVIADASSLAQSSASASSDPEGHTVSPQKSPLIEGIVNQIRAPEYFRLLQKRVSSGWLCFFRVYDTGGQDSYGCTRHVMFSGPRTSYVIAYNAGRSINEASMPATNRQGGVHYKCAEVSPDQPQLAYILHALDAIRNVPGFRESRIYIVGCRIDERKEGKEGLEKDKADILDSLNCDRFREMVTEDRIFFIRNRSSSDHQKGCTPSPDLIKLRHQLTEDGKRQLHVPFARLYEMLAFHELAATPRAEPWISLAEARQLGEMLGIVRDDESLTAMLTYHTGIGSVLYYPSMELKNRVVVGIKAMVEAMSAIIQPGLPDRFKHDRPSKDDKDLYRRCFITESMALILWRQYCPDLKFLLDTEDRKFFLKLMEQLNVLCDIGEVSMVCSKEKRKVYLLPALADNMEEIGPDPKSITSEPFYLATKDGGHLPHSTFTQLGVKSISRHHKEAPSSAAWRGCKISTTAMRIPWQQSPPVWLLLHHLQGGLSLRLEAGKEDFLEQCGPTALATIQKMLEDLKGTANAGLQLEESMRCGCGQKKEVTCMYHRMESCGEQDGCCFHCVPLPADMRNSVMCQSQVVAVNDDGLRVWKELSQDQDTFQLLLLDSAEKATERRASQLPAVNGWQSQEYRRNYENLIKRMRPQELTTKCMTLSLLSDYDLEEIDVEKRASQKNAIILKVLGSSASLFGTFREILHCIPNCRDIAKEVDSVGPTRRTDKDCLHARRVLEKNGNVSTPTD